MVHRFARAFHLRASDWIRRAGRQCRQCRACGQPVHLLADICSHCGAAHPVRIPVVLLVAAALPVLAALLLYRRFL